MSFTIVLEFQLLKRFDKMITNNFIYYDLLTRPYIYYGLWVNPPHPRTRIHIEPSYVYSYLTVSGYYTSQLISGHYFAQPEISGSFQSSFLCGAGFYIRANDTSGSFVSSNRAIGTYPIYNVAPCTYVATVQSGVFVSSVDTLTRLYRSSIPSNSSRFVSSI